MSRKAEACGGGLTLGMVAAGLISWTTWHSVGWAIFHAMCSWLYVIYWALTQP